MDWLSQQNIDEIKIIVLALKKYIILKDDRVKPNVTSQLSACCEYSIVDWAHEYLDHTF